VNTDELQAQAQEHIDAIDVLLQQIAEQQNEDSDEQNEDQIESAKMALQALEGDIAGIVP